MQCISVRSALEETAAAGIDTCLRLASSTCDFLASPCSVVRPSLNFPLSLKYSAGEHVEQLCSLCSKILYALHLGLSLLKNIFTF